MPFDSRYLRQFMEWLLDLEKKHRSWFTAVGLSDYYVARWQRETNDQEFISAKCLIYYRLVHFSLFITVIVLLLLHKRREQRSPVKGPDTVRGLSAGHIRANSTSLLIRTPCSILWSFKLTFCPKVTPFLCKSCWNYHKRQDESCKFQENTSILFVWAFYLFV